MKLNEITGEDEPLLLQIIRQLQQKNVKVAWYIRKGERVVPVWVKSWHEQVIPSPPGRPPIPVWMITGYNGFTQYFQRIAADRIDDWQLIPGKTKGTWQLKRIRGDYNMVVKEGVGDDLMTYMEFAEKNFSAGTREKYDELARQLLKRGYSFIVFSDSGAIAYFKNPPSETDRSVSVRIIGKTKKPTPLHRRVMVKVETDVQGLTKRDYETYEIDDMIDSGADLDFILAGGKK